jgi:RNA polymerase sigma factor (sigma-70 family)
MSDEPRTVVDYLASEECRTRVLRLCNAVAASASDVAEPQDLFQDVLLRALSGAALFRGKSEAEFFAWLKTIAINRVRDLLRRERARPRQLAVLPEVAAEAHDPVEDLASMDVLLSLSSEQVALLRCRLAGLRFEVIANALRISPSAARQRFSRLLAHVAELRRQIEQG